MNIPIKTFILLLEHTSVWNMLTDKQKELFENADGREITANNIKIVIDVDFDDLQYTAPTEEKHKIFEEIPIPIDELLQTIKP